MTRNTENRYTGDLPATEVKRLQVRAQVSRRQNPIVMCHATNDSANNEQD
jgi:hypothetical protein